MKKYIGMTSRDPYIRRNEWISKGRNVQNFRIIMSGLSYDQAQAEEERYTNVMGYCRCVESHSGGPRESGNIYYVYTYEYD